MAKNLSYEEFVEKMKEELKKATPKGYELDFISNDIHVSTDENKVNAVCVKREDAEQGLVMYINNPMFQNFLNFTGSLKDFAKKAIEEVLSFEKQTTVDIEAVLGCTTNIMACLIKTEGNEEFLKEVPHRKFHDLSIYYRHNMEFGTCVISNHELECDQTAFSSEEDLYKIAMLNLETEAVQVEALEKHTIIRFLAGREIENYGARAILSQNFLKTVAKYNEVSKLYVSMSNPHDVMVVPDFDDLMIVMHHEICKTIAAKGMPTTLPGSIYCFDTETKEVSLIEKGVL